MGAGQREWLHEMVDKSRRESLQITLPQVGSKQSGTRAPRARPLDLRKCWRTNEHGHAEVGPVHPALGVHDRVPLPRQEVYRDACLHPAGDRRTPGSQTPYPRLLHRGGALATQRCRSSRGSTLRSGAACSAGMGSLAGRSYRQVPGHRAAWLPRPPTRPAPASPCSCPGSWTLPAGLPEPLPEALQRGPHHKVASFRQGKQVGGGAGRGLVCWPHCTQPSRRPRPVPEGPQLPARPSPRWLSSRGRRTPSVFLGGPSQEGS